MHLVNSVKKWLCKLCHWLWLFYTEDQIATQTDQLRMSKTWKKLPLIVKCNSLFSPVLCLQLIHVHLYVILQSQDEVANTSRYD